MKEESTKDEDIKNTETRTRDNNGLKENPGVYEGDEDFREGKDRSGPKDGPCPTNLASKN